MPTRHDLSLSKVPEVTLGFWIIKIAATTLGETGGDAVTMTLNFSYLVGTAIFATIFIALVAAEIGAKKFHAFLYWAVIVATTTVGTTDGRLLRPLARHRLYRGLDDPGRSADRHPRSLVCGARHRLGSLDSLAQSRDVLLGDNFVFANARHRARRSAASMRRA
jgi:hypothetical protein